MMRAAVLLLLLSACAARLGPVEIVLGDAKVERCVESLERRERVCTTTAGGKLSEPVASALAAVSRVPRAILGMP